eukprot:TRINITY_DN7637_c0_g1_i3.p1 TRINITY_DN7637_c0_g1~~TRINITY_DN7637_c0_g1_i3.p1  ORF type:complete len:148 (+),score=30.40 TRINITY_DN7637_c0_g1_i3:23-466(+)
MSRKLTLQEDNERKKRTKLIDEAQDKDEKIRDEKAQEEQEEDDDGDQDKDKYKDENEDENEEEGDDDDDDDDDADGDDASSDDSSNNCWRCRDDICMKHIARSMGFKAIEIGRYKYISSYVHIDSNNVMMMNILSIHQVKYNICVLI